jgi:isoquinoline 1-oxidoreductase beta subunit
MGRKTNMLKRKSGLNRREALTAMAGLTFGFALSMEGSGTALAQSVAQSGGAIRTAWVTIRSDGTVLIVSPAAEMGQGSRTSLALIIAEELDLDWSRVQVEMSPLDDKIYGNPRYRIMYTAGSASISTYFKPLRLHAAQARRVLIDAAAEKWGAPASELTTEPSVVFHKASGRRMTYGEIASFAHVPTTLPTVSETDLKSAANFRYLGKDVMRVELPTKVDGSAKYSIDMRVPGMLYGVVLRAPIEGSVPESVDSQAAAQTPGVVNVVTLPYGVGILARSPEAAFEGKEKLKVNWSRVPGSTFNSSQALERYAERAKDLTAEGKVWDKAGDVAAMVEARITVEAVYRTDFAYHAQMEPLNALASVSAAGDSAEIWCGTQAPTIARAAAARALGMGENKVVLHPMLLGGGFGRRGHYDAEYVVDAALMSKAAKAPVKVMWSREDDIRNGRFRPMTAQYLKAGLGAEGQVLAWRHRVCSEEALAFQDAPRFKARNERAIFSMLGTEQPSYDFPNRLIDHVRQTDGMRLSSMRGTGNPPNAFVTESFVDELALAVKMEPMQFRRRLVAKVARAVNVLDVLADISRWQQRRPDGRGLGVCFRNEDGTLVGMVAEVSVDRKSGATKVHHVWAVIDAGLAIQPDNISAQIEGAIIYTLGAVFSERITMANGAVEQSNFYDYIVPRMSDVPDIEVKVLSTSNPPSGIGEMGGNVAGAVANAVAAATGARVRHMPLTRERVLAAM